MDTALALQRLLDTSPEEIVDDLFFAGQASAPARSVIAPISKPEIPKQVRHDKKTKITPSVMLLC